MQKLNYKHLHYFWAVAKTGSIAKAAAQLHLAPQSISGQLSEFAEGLGVDLFRRAGRHLELTDAGRRVLSYADEIFAIGDDLWADVQQQRGKKLQTLRVGISDSVSKSIAYHLLEPAYAFDAVRLVCREGRLAGLLSELAINRLDLIIADQPIPSSIHIKGFSHFIGEGTLALYGTPSVIAGLKAPFPQGLQQAPLLLIGEDAIVRGKINRWLQQQALYPTIRGEFDDGALMKAFGQAGVGLFFAPKRLSERICQQYQVQQWAEIKDLSEQFYVITSERQLRHPIIKAICDRGDVGA